MNLTSRPYCVLRRLGDPEADDGLRSGTYRSSSEFSEITAYFTLRTAISRFRGKSRRICLSFRSVSSTPGFRPLAEADVVAPRARFRSGQQFALASLQGVSRGVCEGLTLGRRKCRLHRHQMRVLAPRYPFSPNGGHQLYPEYSHLSRTSTSKTNKR